MPDTVTLARVSTLKGDDLQMLPEALLSFLQSISLESWDGSQAQAYRESVDVS
jgi:hypothetical protein